MTAKTLTAAQELELLRAENAALKANKAKQSSISFRVSVKGAMSLYGLGRFPVTLYKEQWQRLLGEKSNIEAFIQANDVALRGKEDKEVKE